MVIDCHWHTEGTETSSKIAEALDRAGLDKAILFAPYNGGDEDCPGMGMEDANKWMADMVAKLPDKVIGFAWIEPTLPGAVEEVERCVNDYGLRGVKMIPNRSCSDLGARFLAEQREALGERVEMAHLPGSE